MSTAASETHKLQFMILALIIGACSLLLSFSCSSSASSSESSSVVASATHTVDAAPPRTFAYLLQADRFAPTRAEARKRLARSDRDWIILDTAYTGGTQGEWTKSELRTIRRGKSGRKILAYISIGEAEVYRSYWRKDWDADRDGTPDAGAPAFLDRENPEWEGNYKVRYWHWAWQRLILREIDRTVSQGFDGVYLDIVDGYEYFELEPASGEYIDDRINPQTGRSYRADMIRFVKRIAADARSRHRPATAPQANSRRTFLVVPQNGTQLLNSPSYLSTISAVGVEDLFTKGNSRQSSGHTSRVRKDLVKVKRSKKPVLLIEYARRAHHRKIAMNGALRDRYMLLLTDRELHTLGRSVWAGASHHQ